MPGEINETAPLEQIHRWCEFGQNRAYVLMAIARRAHNEELSNSKEIVYRKVLTRSGHIEDKYEDLRALIGRHDYTFRIYLSVNARDTLDAYFNFRGRMNGWIQDLMNGDEHASKKLARVDRYWISELHKPEAKADQYFQFDVDDVTPEEVNDFIDELQDETNVLEVRETPNGAHVITQPFNYTEFEPTIEYDDLDTDGQLHLEEVLNDD